MFKNEIQNINIIKNKLKEIEEDMLPSSFERDDEVEEAFNHIKRLLDTISNSLTKQAREE